jgi:hypothetical protein
MNILSAQLKALIAFIIGLILAALAILGGTAAMTPSAKQSDAPLIVYGQDG